MVVSLKANKKRIVAVLVLAIAVVGACVFLRGGDDPAPQTYLGSTNEERVSFLEGFGWQVDTEPAETREVMIPAEFNDVYTTYNVMQKAQGFDLLPYAGEVVTQYQYLVQNYPNETEVYATLLVYGDTIIGGDIACSRADGFMHGFAKDSAAYGETAQGSSESQMESEVSSATDDTSSISEVSSEPEDTTDSEGVESTAGELYEEGAYPTD